MLCDLIDKKHNREAATISDVLSIGPISQDIPIQDLY